MHRRPTLYKIMRNPASGDSIVVETTNGTSAENQHILFCGGFHSSMQGIKAEFLSAVCQKHDWGFTRFDYQGHGVSDAAFEHCSLHDWLGDTLAVLDQLAVKPILVGSSMGAWLSVQAAVQRPTKIQALVTIAAAPDFTEKLLWPSLSTTQQNAIQRGECVIIPTDYDGPDWRIRAGLIDSGRDLALLNNNDALNISVPVRMLHGTGDTDVPWTLSQQLLEKLEYSSDASLTLLRGADHRLSDTLSLNALSTALEHISSLR